MIIGTVMEVYKNEVLVMTSDFDLVRVKKKPEIFLGQQVSFRKRDVIRPEVRKMKLIGVAAVLLVVFIASYIIQNTRLSMVNASYALVDMDINPSIEFLIDDANIVQKVLPLNSDAENLTKVLSLKKLHIKEAVEKVIDESEEKGILSSNKNNVIMLSASLNPESSDYKDGKERNELKLNQLLTSLKAIDDVGFNKEYTLNVVKVEPEMKKQALKNGLSTGRQLIFEKAQSEGINLTLDEAKTSSLSALLEKIGMNGPNTVKEHLSSPAVQSTEKVTSAVKSTSEKETATTPTPAPVSAGIENTDAKAPSVSTNIRPASTKIPNVSTGIRPANTKMPGASTSKGAADAKIPDSSAGSIKVQYYNASRKVDNVFIQVNDVFNVVNTGSTTINLKDIAIRYYYTIDGEKGQALGCWAQDDKSNITYRFVKMSKPVEKADYYLEIGFKSGQLDPGKSTEVVVWFHKEDWSIYKQEDDYSYNSPDIGELYDWKYVTGYISGDLKWGIEPGK
ncbi:anti-sigma-I factor RsgI family protein [Acetivibrio cellulolyticus]|uniref:anti-sigma-I factor RsgI family protein n=1 Tax=Acetivibrio cellulolyticus TaxID=35830 RepID=UPI0001E2D087|nr:cellulose binding domain-containing protein [Acetivibrio cellulolyticus]